MSSPSQPLNQEPYRIFVAGVASGISKKTILGYFQRFGHIIDVIEIRKKSKEDFAAAKRPSATAAPGSICRGICCVVTSSISTYNNILDQVDHSIKGRAVMCYPFQKRRTALKQSLENNKRRVILKKVPAVIEEHVILRRLESSFGKVAVFFSFLPEVLKSKSENTSISRRNFKSYSVMFETLESCEKITVSGTISIEGFDHIVVEPFKLKHRYKELNNKLEDNPKMIDIMKTATTLEDGELSNTDVTKQKTRSCSLNQDLKLRQMGTNHGSLIDHDLLKFSVLSQKFKFIPNSINRPESYLKSDQRLRSTSLDLYNETNRFSATRHHIAILCQLLKTHRPLSSASEESLL